MVLKDVTHMFGACTRNIQNTNAKLIVVLIMLERHASSFNRLAEYLLRLLPHGARW